MRQELLRIRDLAVHFETRRGVARAVDQVDLTLYAGERFGLIRFGSRLDVYFPVGTQPKVALGQTMIAGETVLADLSAPQSPAQSLTRVS